MKDKEKQIEEMAKEMCKVCKSIEETCYMKKQPCSLIKDEAKTLYNAGYRKLPQDSVVLSRKEYEELLARPLETMGDLVISKIKNKDYELVKKENYDKLCHLAYFGYEDYYEKGSKETAEKFLNMIYWKAVKHINGKNKDECFIEISFEKLDEIAKQFGAEIKE